MRHQTISLVALITMSVPTYGQPAEPGRLAQSEEIAIALSAAPPHIGEGAGVYVLGTNGFEMARPSENGFACLVERSAADPKALGPQCYDREAASTVMQVVLVASEMRADGVTEDELSTTLDAMLGSGELRPPSRAAIGYRLSSRQYLGEKPGRWFPHIRVYAPYLTNEDILGDTSQPQSPFVFGNEGGPFAYIVIVVSDEYDPVF